MLEIFLIVLGPGFDICLDCGSEMKIIISELDNRRCPGFLAGIAANVLCSCKYRSSMTTMFHSL